MTVPVNDGSGEGKGRNPASGFQEPREGKSRGGRVTPRKVGKKTP